MSNGTLATQIYRAASGFEEGAYRVYPIYAPQEAQPPWITYQINQTSEQDEFSYQLEGQMNPYWATFYVVLWTPDFTTTDSLVEPFIGHMYSIRGDGIDDFQKIEFMGREDLALDDLTLFGSQLKFRGFTNKV